MNLKMFSIMCFFKNLLEKTEKGRKLYCRDPFMPVPRQTLHNWRAAEEGMKIFGSIIAL